MAEVEIAIAKVKIYEGIRTKNSSPMNKKLLDKVWKDSSETIIKTYKASERFDEIGWPNPADRNLKDYINRKTQILRRLADIDDEYQKIRGRWR